MTGRRGVPATSIPVTSRVPPTSYPARASRRSGTTLTRARPPSGISTTTRAAAAITRLKRTPRSVLSRRAGAPSGIRARRRGKLKRSGAESDIRMSRGLRFGDDVALLDRTARRAASSRNPPDDPDSLPERILRLGLAIALVGGWSARRLVVLSLILVFSLDDIARYHENLGSAVREDVGAQSGYGRLIWPIVFFPLLGTAFVLLWRLSERVYERAARFIRLGLVMLVLAVFAEAGSTVFHVGSDAEGTFPDVLEVSVEESLELAAWVLIAAAITATLCSVLY